MKKITKKRLRIVGMERKPAPDAGSPAGSSVPFQHPIFASEAEYDQSVESVVARIRSGQVKARLPDL